MRCGDRGPHPVTHRYRVGSFLFVPLFVTSEQFVATCRGCGLETTLTAAPHEPPPLPFMQRAGLVAVIPVVLVIAFGAIFSRLFYDAHYIRLDRERDEKVQGKQDAADAKAAAATAADQTRVGADKAAFDRVIETIAKIHDEDRACDRRLAGSIPSAAKRRALPAKSPKDVTALTGAPFSVADVALYSRDNHLLGARQLCVTALTPELDELARTIGDRARFGPAADRQAEADRLLVEASTSDVPPVFAVLDGECDAKSRRCTGTALWMTGPRHDLLAVAQASVPSNGDPDEIALKRLGGVFAKKANAWR